MLVLSGTRMPSALVEIGFISHPQEGRQLAREKYQSRIALALSNAVRDFADKVLSRRLLEVAQPPEAAPPPVNAAGIVASPAGTR